MDLKGMGFVSGWLYILACTLLLVDFALSSNPTPVQYSTYLSTLPTRTEYLQLSCRGFVS